MDKTEYRDFLVEYLSQHGFTERFSTKTKDTDNEEIVEKIIDKGVFTTEENYLAIWDNSYAYKIENLVKEKVVDLIKVDKVYEGEEYLLVLVGTKIHCFKEIYYKELMSIAHALYYENVISDNFQILVGTSKKYDSKILFIKTDIIYLGLSGMATDSSEEERIILSSKLEQAQSFFEVRAPKYYDWVNLKDNKSENFERIVETLLQKEKNLTKITPIGKTNAADRGRDFDVIENNSTLNKIISKKWLVQCKFSEKSISPNSISGWVDRVIEHNYDGYWLITNNDITPSLFDQFKDVEKNPKYKIDVKYWQRTDLHIKMNLYNELFKDLNLFK